MFWLKKAVSYWLMPVPVCLLLLCVGTGLLYRGRGARAGRVLVALAVVLLLVLSNRYVSSMMLGSLEGRFPAVPEASPGAVPGQLQGCRFVAILGGGNTDMPGKPATSELSTSALSRLVEGVRILRLLPGARLIVSGPGDKGHPTHASVLASAAVSLGIERSRITLLESARDTEDESVAISRIAGGARIALVTSSWHMPRAARLFRDAGASFVACPADFIARTDAPIGFESLLWGSDGLERSTLAIHEWLGLLWLSLRGAA